MVSADLKKRAKCHKRMKSTYNRAIKIREKYMDDIPLHVLKTCGLEELIALDLKLPALRTILRQRHLSTYGRKMDLILRIVEDNIYSEERKLTQLIMQEFTQEHSSF
jgi:hypothetical protein